MMARSAVCARLVWCDPSDPLGIIATFDLKTESWFSGQQHIQTRQVCFGEFSIQDQISLVATLTTTFWTGTCSLILGFFFPGKYD